MSDIQNLPNPDQKGIQRPPLGIYEAFSGRGVRASVFQNKNRETGRFYSTVTYTRAYKDKETGNWKYSSTLRGWEQSQMSLLVHEASKLQNKLDRLNHIADREQGLTYNQEKRGNIQAHAPLQHSTQPPQTSQSQAQPITGLTSQRDVAMAKCVLPQNGNNIATPQRQLTQEP